MCRWNGKSLNVTLSTHATENPENFTTTLLTDINPNGQSKIWWVFIFVYYFVSSECGVADTESRSVGESLHCRMRWPEHTKHERLKHVTNDSRLDLSFIIVFDTCRRHRPLFCHLHNNNRLWHVAPNLIPVRLCIVKCTKANKENKIFGKFPTKKSHISWRHKHVFNISACKHDKLRFQSIMKMCTYRRLRHFTHRLTSIHQPPGN